MMTATEVFKLPQDYKTLCICGHEAIDHLLATTDDGCEVTTCFECGCKKFEVENA